MVCDGPSQMMEVIDWFLKSAATGDGGMHVCKIKNKFALHKDQLVRTQGLNLSASTEINLLIIGASAVI